MMDTVDLIRYAKCLDTYGVIPVREAERINRILYNVTVRAYILLERMGYLERVGRHLIRTKMTHEELAEKVQTWIVCMDDESSLAMLATMPCNQSCIMLEVSERAVNRIRAKGTVDYPLLTAEYNGYTVIIDAGVTPIQQVTLNHIRSNPGHNIMELSKTLGVNCNTMRCRVKRLIDMGLVQSKRNGMGRLIYYAEATA